MQPERIGSRYRVVSLLGEGGMGAVYRCLDEITGEQVALKTLMAGGDNPERSLWRFRREFTAMQRLDHPHCVKVFDFGQDEACYFFTMEYIDGGPFTRLQGKSAVLPLSLQVLAALDYIHSQGIIHRDLKPHNVLVEDEPWPRAVLADFGIAKVLGEEHQLTSAGGVLGTLAYLSPEQAEGKVVDPRADLYSFGVLLYESLLGRFPYVLPTPVSPVDYLRVHVVEEPIRPRRIRADLPVELEALLLGLLAKEPSHRPPCAAAVFDALLPFASAGGLPEVSTPEGRFLLTPRLSGRGREKGLLEEAAWRALGMGRECVLLLSGEAGSGKSRLLEEVSAQLRRGGVSLLYGAGEEGSPHPYSVWLGPLRRIQEELAQSDFAVKTEPNLEIPPWPDLVLADLPSVELVDGADGEDELQKQQDETIDETPEIEMPGAPADAREGLISRSFGESAERTGDVLQKILPELRSGPLSREGLISSSFEDAAQERWALLRSLAELLAEQGKKKKVAIILEDLHVADEGSLELLQFLARAVSRSEEKPSLVVLGTYRTDEVGEEHPLRQTVSRLLSEGLASEVTLSSLSEEACGELIASALGMEKNQEIEELGRKLHVATAGNPFYLLELLKNLLADNRIRRVKGRWDVSGARMGQTSLLPENFREAIRRRLGRLSPEVKELLEIFAVCGRTASLDLLLRASGLSEEDLLTYLDDAVRARLIEEVEPGATAFRFLNDPTLETLYEDLPPGRKRKLHKSVAAALTVLKGDAGVLGRHLLRAGERERARELFLQAGDRSLRAYDGARAASWYEEALAISADAVLEERLGRAYDLSGKLDEAERHLQEALAAQGEVKDRIRRLRALAEVKRKRGSMAEAAEALEEAMRLLGTPLPKSRAGVFGSILGQGLLRAAHNIGLKSQVKAERREVEAQVARLAASLTHVLYYVDYEKSVAAHLHMLNLAERLGPSEELASAYLYHGVALGTIGREGEAREYLERGRKMAEEKKARPLVERAGAYEVWLDWTQGKVRRAAEEAERLLQTRRPRDPFDLATLLYVAAAARIARGECALASIHTMSLEQLAAETRSRYTHGTAQLHQGILLLAESKLEGAYNALSEAQTAFLESGGRVYAISAASYLGRVLLLGGSLEQAISVLEEAQRDVERFHVKDPLVMVYPFLALAYLARARHLKSDAKANAQNLASARAAAKQGCKLSKIFPIQIPLANQAMALVEEERGQKKQADTLIKEAVVFAEANEMLYERLEE